MYVKYYINYSSMPEPKPELTNYNWATEEFLMSSNACQTTASSLAHYILGSSRNCEVFNSSLSRASSSNHSLEFFTPGQNYSILDIIRMPTRAEWISSRPA